MVSLPTSCAPSQAICATWPDLAPLVEFAINDSASSLGSATWRACAEFNVELLLQYLRRPDHPGGAVALPPPVDGANGRPEHWQEVQEMLKFKMRWANPTCWYAGRGTMRRATRGNRSTT